MYIGEKIGKLTVIKEVDKLVLPSGQTNRAFLCKCDCGNEKVIRLLHLKRFRTLSCGCLAKVRNGEGNTYLCKVWRGIKYRTSPNYFEKHLYYDKGILVCNEWLNSWDAFKKWSYDNGYKKGLQIDRINNSMGYSPDNCRWVDCITNVNNRDCTFNVIYNGQEIPFMILIRKKGLLKQSGTIRSRIKRGWSIERAIETPIKTLQSS